MRLVNHQTRTGITIAIAVIVLTVLFAACSEEYTSPMSSGSESFPPPSEFRYPELTPEMLAAGPAPGYRFVQIPSALDYGGDTVATSKVCKRGRDENLNISHMLELRIYAGRLQQDNTLVTVIAPLGPEVAVADFYPHPYQFVNGTVRIKWKLSEMGFPAGTDFSTFVPFYVDDNGNYIEMPHEWEHGYDNLLVYTDHFSRYIIGQADGG